MFQSIHDEDLSFEHLKPHFDEILFPLICHYKIPTGKIICQQLFANLGYQWWTVMDSVYTVYTGRAVYLHCCVRSQLLWSLRLAVIASSLRWLDLQIGNTDVFLYFFCDFLKQKKTILGSKIPTNWINCGDFSQTRDFPNEMICIFVKIRFLM